jgi:hypothetical protein
MKKALCNVIVTGFLGLSSASAFAMDAFNAGLTSAMNKSASDIQDANGNLDDVNNILNGMSRLRVQGYTCKCSGSTLVLCTHESLESQTFDVHCSPFR